MQLNNNSALSMLLHGQGAAISASILDTIKYNTEILPFKDWQESFNQGLSQIRDLNAHQISNYQTSYNQISNLFGGDDKADKIDRLLNSVTQRAKGKRWSYESFFSRNTDPGVAEKILGFYDGNGKYQNWSTDEIEGLKEGIKPIPEADQFLREGRTSYELHHGLAESRIAGDDIGTRFDADNLRIVSPKGHLDYFHKGAWQDTSDKPFSEVSDRTDQIRQAERSYHSSNSNIDEIIGISMGIAAGSISAIIKYRELSKSPLPWNQRKVLTLAGSFVSGAATGVVPYLVLQEVSVPIKDFLTEGIADVFNSGNMLIQDSLLDNLADASGSFFVIMSAIAVRSLLQGAFQSRQIGIKEAAKNLGSTLARTSIEQGAFSALGLLLDCITPIPDPVLGPTITVLRVSYSVVKMTLSVKHQKAITYTKLNSLHDAAYAVVIG